MMENLKDEDNKYGSEVPNQLTTTKMIRVPELEYRWIGEDGKPITTGLEDRSADEIIKDMIKYRDTSIYSTMADSIAKFIKKKFGK